MPHILTKSADIPKKEKLGIRLDVLPNIGNVGVVVAETENGHNQEFKHTSSFHYFILDGAGTFVLDDEEVPVAKGDLLTIAPGTRIYYKGRMRLLLVTDPAWTEAGETETKSSIW